MGKENKQENKNTMFNRFTQLALGTALATFAGYGVANADHHGEENPCGENPCGDMGEENPCGDMGEENPCGDANPCGDMNPCGDAGGGDMGGEEAAAASKIKIGLTAVVNLSKDAVADPIAIMPDISYAVMPKLTAGLYHSPQGITGWFGGFGGICVGDSCGDTYSGPAALLADYSVMAGDLSVAASGGLTYTKAGDLTLLSIKVGAKITKAMGKIIIMAQPAIFVGATERDFNKEVLHVPIAVGFAASDKLTVALQTGIWGPLDGLGDFYQVPVEAAAFFAVNPQITAWAGLSFLNLAGKGSTADARGINLGASYAL